MTELLDKLVKDAGLTPAQATQALEVVKDFVKEKFPMLSGAVDNIFGTKIDQASVAATVAEEQEKESGNWVDRISDVIPGDIGEKLEDITRKAADKAEDMYDKGKGKFDGFFDKK